MSNSLDSDQARRFVGPDLFLNCLLNYQHMALVVEELGKETFLLRSFEDFHGSGYLLNEAYLHFRR